MGCGAIIIVGVICFVLAQSGAPWWGYAVVVVCAIAWAHDNKKPAEVPQPIPPEPLDREEIEAEVRAEIIQEYAVTLRQINRRERAVAMAEATLERDTRMVLAMRMRAEPNADNLKPGSLKLIRNTLMKLHEARRTDTAYQQSETHKQATAILQGLNNLIEKSK